MKIKEPKLNYLQTRYACIKYADKYNIGKQPGEGVRYSDLTLFEVYAKLLQRKINRQRNMAKHSCKMIIDTDSNQFNSVLTNNAMISQLMGFISNSTIHSHYRRLLSAGIVKKINHHLSNNSYEIIINPHLLFISDLSNPTNILKPDLEKAMLWNKKAETTKREVEVHNHA